MYNSSSEEDDDVFYQNEEEGRRKIAEKDYELNVKGCYEVGYHGGLVGGLEKR